jgi:predicted membrane metal-binding protein
VISPHFLAAAALLCWFFSPVWVWDLGFGNFFGVCIKIACTHIYTYDSVFIDGMMMMILG